MLGMLSRCQVLEFLDSHSSRAGPPGEGEKLVSAPGLSPGRTNRDEYGDDLPKQFLSFVIRADEGKVWGDKESVCGVEKAIRRQCGFLFYITVAQILKSWPTETLS